MKGIFKNKWVAASAGIILTSAILVSSFAFLFSDKQDNLVRSAETDPGLLDYDASSSVNFTSILGRSIDYGILSGTIDFRDHMETTYATKLLKTLRKGENSNNSDVDLAGGAPAQFIIADIEGDSRAVFDKTYTDATMDFVIDTTQELVNQNKFQTNGAFNGQLLFRTYSYDELINNLNSMITRMQKQSKMLADKPAFDGDSFVSNGKALVDLSDSNYENCTIYINVAEGSALERAIANENLEIIKHSSTVVVFNMLLGAKISP